MSLPAAGWFPDPQDGTRLRWWDGTTWGGETRPAPVRVEQLAGPVVSAVPAGPAFSVRTSAGAVESRTWAYGSTARRFCLASCLSVLFAIASTLVNPLGACSAVGVLLGVIGIAKPRGTGAWRVFGRSLSASAVVIAVATGIVAVNEALHLF